jgi:hypothetical protein
VLYRQKDGGKDIFLAFMETISFLEKIKSNGAQGVLSSLNRTSLVPYIIFIHYMVSPLSLLYLESFEIYKVLGWYLVGIVESEINKTESL